MAHGARAARQAPIDLQRQGVGMAEHRSVRHTALMGGEREMGGEPEMRPWGSYTVLEDASTHKVKRI